MRKLVLERIRGSRVARARGNGGEQQRKIIDSFQSLLKDAPRVPIRWTATAESHSIAIVRVLPLVSSSENLFDGWIQDLVLHVVDTYTVLTWFTYKLAAISDSETLKLA